MNITQCLYLLCLLLQHEFHICTMFIHSFTVTLAAGGWFTIQQLNNVTNDGLLSTSMFLIIENTNLFRRISHCHFNFENVIKLCSVELMQFSSVHTYMLCINYYCLPICFPIRSEEHTSELQSRETISYAVFCLKKKT